MIHAGIQNITDSPHATFLRELQEWVWRRFPVHQLSATDIFYAIQWAQTGISADMLTDYFEAWLQDHPHHFDDGFRLTRLKIQAEHAIADFRKKPVVSVSPILVNDPFKSALDVITICGKQAENPLLRDALRVFYQAMREAQREAVASYPDWTQRQDVFYMFKARAHLAWDEHLARLFEHSFGMLSEPEQAEMQQLTAQEKLHCMHIGDEAKQHYIQRCLYQRIATYFHIESLLEHNI